MAGVEEVAKSVPILDVAKELDINHKGNRNIPCIKGHDSNTASLSFDIRRNTFKCFGCGIGTDSIDLVQEVLGLDFVDTMEWFNEHFDVKPGDKLWKYKKKNYIAEIKKVKIESEVEKEYEITTNDYENLYNSLVILLTEDIDSHYLVTERKISKEVVRENNIVNKDADVLKKLLKGKKISKYGEWQSLLGYLLMENKTLPNEKIREAIESSGLVAFKYSSYLIPFYNINDDFNADVPVGQGNKERFISYFQGISVGDAQRNYKKYSYMGGREKPLLYIPKSFNKFKTPIFITEGVVDALSLQTLGVNSVALMDASARRDSEKLQQLDVLKGYKIVLLLDNDIPGERAKEVLMNYMQDSCFNVERRTVKDIAKQYGVGGYIKDANSLLLKLWEENKI